MVLVCIMRGFPTLQCRHLWPAYLESTLTLNLHLCKGFNLVASSIEVYNPDLPVLPGQTTPLRILMGSDPLHRTQDYYNTDLRCVNVYGNLKSFIPSAEIASVMR
jgi:hypothetical protein